MKVVNFFEKMYGIRPDEGRECGYVILNNQQKEVVSDYSFEELVQDAFNKMGINANVDKLFIDERKPFLPMPNIGEYIRIKILSSPKVVDSRFNENGMLTIRCKVAGSNYLPPQSDDLECDEYDLIITSTIYKGMINELRDYRIPVDDDMKCIVGLNFAIEGIEWLSAPKHFWKNCRPPKIYSVTLLI